MTDKEFLEQFQMMIKGMGDMEARLNQKIEHAVSESEARTRVYIENEVGRRIDSLFDGYKLAYKKQWELEHRADAMQKQIDELQVRLAALENRTA